MKTGNRFLILTGGALDLKFAQAYLEKENFDCVCTVDNGLDYAKTLKLRVDYAIGDFDTARCELVAEFKEHGDTCFHFLNPEKDATDTEVAIDFAISHQPSEVVILGALGKRFDHSLANLSMLYRLRVHGVTGYIIDEYNKITLIDHTMTIRKNEQYGKYVSLMPFMEKVEKVTLEGFYYSLKDATLYPGSSLCVSNEIKEDTAVISFEKGILVVVESHD